MCFLIHQGYHSFIPLVSISSSSSKYSCLSASHLTTLTIGSQLWYLTTWEFYFIYSSSITRFVWALSITFPSVTWLQATTLPQVIFYPLSSRSFIPSIVSCLSCQLYFLLLCQESLIFLYFIPINVILGYLPSQCPSHLLVGQNTPPFCNVLRSFALLYQLTYVRFRVCKSMYQTLACFFSESL